MTSEILVTLIILAVAVGLFASGRFEFDHVALAVLAALFFTKLVPIDSLFDGFSNRAIITIASVYVISGGIARTGVAYFVGQRIGRLAGKSEGMLVGLTMGSAASLSSFMNDVGSAAVMLPAIIAAARTIRVGVSRVLLPLAYGARLGGMLTLVATPANLLVNGVMEERGYEGFSLFEFTPIGVSILGAGLVVMIGFRKWILPDHPAGAGVEDMMPRKTTEHEPYRLRERLSEVLVPEGSALAGQTIMAAGLGRDFGVWVQAIYHGDERTISPNVDTTVASGDRLIVSARDDDLARFAEAFDLFVDTSRQPRSADFFGEDLEVAEIAVMPRSSNIGKTLPDVKFADNYGLTVLGIWRDGRPHRTHLAEISLQQGDALLVQGPGNRVRDLREEGDQFTVMTDQQGIHFRRSRAPLAIVILLLYITGMATGVAPVAVVALTAAVAMITVGAITMREARTTIEWRAILLVGGMLAMAEAMTTSGSAKYLAETIVDLAGGNGPGIVLAAVLILSSGFSILINNHVTAVLMTPLALGAAVVVGGDPRMFAMAVALGAATGFAAPFSHPANILVMGPGNYRFADYMRAGLPLLVAVLAVGYVVLLVMFR